MSPLYTYRLRYENSSEDEQDYETTDDESDDEVSSSDASYTPDVSSSSEENELEAVLVEKFENSFECFKKKLLSVATREDLYNILKTEETSTSKRKNQADSWPPVKKIKTSNYHGLRDRSKLQTPEEADRKMRIKRKLSILESEYNKKTEKLKAELYK